MRHRPSNHHQAILMTKRQLALLEYHRGLGDFSVTSDMPAFFILDLEDDDARGIAESIKDTGGPDNIDGFIKFALEGGKIPSLTARMPLGSMNAIIEAGWDLTAKPEPPESMFYIVLISGGVVIALLPKELNQPHENHTDPDQRNPESNRTLCVEGCDPLRPERRIVGDPGR